MWISSEEMAAINAKRQASTLPFGQAYSMMELEIAATIRKRVEAAPNLVLDLLLVCLHERMRQQFPTEQDTQRIAEANTPDNRQYLYLILSALQEVPLSWATSATTRFFRGTGKQAEMPWRTKVGFNLLSKDYGWTGDEATCFVNMFYERHILGQGFFSNVSPDPYGEEGMEILDSGGNRFAATQVERNTAFISTLQSLLEARGLGAAPTPTPVEVPKRAPRKAKVWAVGEAVTQRNYKDLPENALLKRVCKYARYNVFWEKDKIQSPDVDTFWCVYISSANRSACVWPVMREVAHKEITVPSTKLYKDERGLNVVTFEGIWGGNTPTKSAPWHGERNEIKMQWRDNDWVQVEWDGEDWVPVNQRSSS